MCRSPNHAGASEANLSTVSWLMKRPSRAVHQALQRQRVIARRRSAGGGRGGKLRPEPELGRRQCAHRKGAFRRLALIRCSGDRLRRSFSEPRFGVRLIGSPRRRSPRMKLVWAAIDPQQAAAEPRDRISGYSRALPGGHGEKKVRLNFLSSDSTHTVERIIPKAGVVPTMILVAKRHGVSVGRVMVVGP